MLTDPLGVTYDGSAKSLPRVSVGSTRTVYRTSDSEFEVVISSFKTPQNGSVGKSIALYRRIPDPTPSNVFDDYREVRNGFGLTYVFDADTRAETSVDVPRLRTALLALVDTTLQGRIIAGEQ
jgi:hypothetical protein